MDASAGKGRGFRLSALRRPPSDRDGDGLEDRVDPCPDLPGPAQGGRAGCPATIHVQVTPRQIRLLKPIAFRFNRDMILPRSFEVLDQVAAVLRSRPRIRVRVEGHFKPLRYSMRISRRRARAVRRYLVRKGVSIDRIEARGYGEMRPLVPPHTTAARARNWRIEVHFLGGAVVP